MSAKTFLAEANKNADIKRQILRLCILNNSYSIADLSKEINTSVPTVTKIIGELIDEGFMLDMGKVGTSGGRRPSIFGLNADAGYFIGVDIARQHFHIAITDFKGEVVTFIPDIEFVLEARADSFKSLCRLVKKEVSDAGIAWEKVLSVGVSLSGRVNPEEGYSMSYFMSDDLPLNAIFEKDFNVPVSIENDSRAMTYAEYLAGGYTLESRNMLAVNLSWGLGMGMILDGKLYYGKSGFSGEIGHVPLLDNEKICRCGKVGCLETGASGSALHEMILEKLKSGRPSSLSKIYTTGAAITLDDILKAVEEEDVLAIDCIGKIGETLGRGIAGLINIFNPELVIIGGRLIVGKKYLMYPIKTSVNKYSLNRVSSDTKIVYSTLGRKAASIGNCLIARSKYLGLF
ncbi:MAG: ROK family protein [Bacteroidales bacterium]|nr:ROK family protein [Bacteroidales bacterium]